jgi:hypothetical protein
MSQKHARPEMTRRTVSNPSAEQSQREIDAMNAKLKARVKSIASGSACQEAGAVWGVPLAEKTPSLTDQQQLLGSLTGAKPIPPVYPDEPNREVKPITQTVTVPQGVDTTPILEWYKPVRHANGEATQTSTGGAYAVFGRRSPSGFVFIAKRGLDCLGAPQATAEAAREICLAHLREACA